MLEVAPPTEAKMVENPPVVIPAKVSGVKLPPAPRRLDREERVALQEHFGHLSEGELRRRLQVSPDLYDRAVAGAELPPEIISKLVGAIITLAD